MDGRKCLETSLLCPDHSGSSASDEFTMSAGGCKSQTANGGDGDRRGNGRTGVRASFWIFAGRCMQACFWILCLSSAVYSVWRVQVLETELRQLRLYLRIPNALQVS